MLELSLPNIFTNLFYSFLYWSLWVMGFWVSEKLCNEKIEILTSLKVSKDLALCSEPLVQSCSVKNVFLEISQNSQENTIYIYIYIYVTIVM